MASRLRRTLALPHVIVYGVGTMVGAGIYSVIGSAAAEAGEALWLSFLLAGAIAFLTVLAYGELAALYPRAGAEYQYLRAAFPQFPLLGVLAGYLISLSAASTSATVALAFAGYLDSFVDLPNAVVAVALLAICTAINIAGINQSTWVTSALVTVEVGGLLLVIGAGLFAGDWSRPAAPAAAELPGGVIAATALVFFIYMGFEDVANLSEETRNPRWTIPRALVVSVFVTTGLYLLIAVAALSLSSPAAMSASSAPLAMAAGNAAPWLARAVAVAALFATASTALIVLVSISRMILALAREGEMPRLLAKVLPERQSPWLAALVLFAGALVLLPLGSIRVVASVSSFSVLLVFIGVQAAVIALRFTHPERARPFRVPLSIGRLPILPVVGILASASLLTQFEGRVYAIGLAIIGLGTFAQFVRGRRRRRRA